MRRRSILLFLLACLPVLAFDVSGTWEFAVETEAGSGTPTFVFRQDGEKLTGTYTGLLGKADLTGTVKGNQIEFHFDVSGQVTGRVTYKGTIESPTKMKGEAQFAELGKGTWTGTKK